MSDLHIHQYLILRKLTFEQSVTFTQLNVEKYSTDHHTYHLNSLIDKGYIQKSGSSEYSLTIKGKTLVAKLDHNLPIVKSQAKLHISFVCHRIRNGVDEYVFHKRSKTPFLGWVGFPSAKLDLNSFVIENALQKLDSELGLKGDGILKGIQHILVKLEKEDAIIEDKFFYIVVVTNLKGKLIKDNNDGKNSWSTLSELKGKKIFPSIDKYLGLINSAKTEFWEEIQYFDDI